jgi:hypothetical protein
MWRFTNINIPSYNVEEMAAGGFENGAAGWFGTGTITTTEAHSGTHSLELTGNEYEYQEIGVISTSEAASWTFWAINSAGSTYTVTIAYNSGPSTTFTIPQSSTWTEYNLASLLTPGEYINQITFSGTTGGPVYIDDVSLQVEDQSVGGPVGLMSILANWPGGTENYITFSVGKLTQFQSLDPINPAPLVWYVEWGGTSDGYAGGTIIYPGSLSYNPDDLSIPSSLITPAVNNWYDLKLVFSTGADQNGNNFQVYINGTEVDASDTGTWGLTINYFEGVQIGGINLGGSDGSTVQAYFGDIIDPPTASPSPTPTPTLTPTNPPSGGGGNQPTPTPTVTPTPTPQSSPNSNPLNITSFPWWLWLILLLIVAVFCSLIYHRVHTSGKKRKHH